MSDCQCPQCQQQTVVDPPQYVYQDYYHPQPVTVVHPIQVIRRHHCVPCPQHVYAYGEQDVWCSSVENRRKRSSRK
ncbi:hypothetical protein GE107_15345 [Cohnella sp. CFH 77786]|uniref:hypothetical protein n=1 Tax=Cohnella sp. CFH 77786 TaxID=2662265 RepID=UPI001C60C296|nr:hypothetical protein [Cohnella sp. CFH 77786]MBW5447432.1 hypothetical protein [Cohnella sp. CFH 77786]